MDKTMKWKREKWFIERIGFYVLYTCPCFNITQHSIRITDIKKAKHLFLSQQNKIARFKKHPNEKK